MRRFRKFPLIALALILGVPAGGLAGAGDTGAVEAINAMQRTAHANLTAHIAPETGAYDFIDAVGDEVVAKDNATLAPTVRARAFLRRYGAAVGITQRERRSIDSVLRVKETYVDPAANSHVRFTQTSKGRDVFGGALVVHMNRKGITGVSGIYVPNITVAKSPSVSKSRAGVAALNALTKAYRVTDLKVAKTSITVFRSGLIEGRRGTNHLAYQIEIAGPQIREQVMVDAMRGIVLRRIPALQTARERVAYSPQYDPHNPDMFALRKEGQGPTHIPPVDKLYDYTGDVYDLFHNTFGRDSFDGKGHTMRTVYLINDQCPNAYWNSSSTNYCPAFDHDDVVSHEWTHAFTEYTHGLIYSCEPGALNESYSDIFGETLDLINGVDEVQGGTNNNQPYPGGQRWIVGEDLGKPVQELLLRDMWDPERLASPGRVTGEEFVCDITSDGGGVHTNSGIPNHAYAMLVDGKTYNGKTIKGIGLTKAAHIYYQAMLAYQTPTTKFRTHALSLMASCADLIGVNLKELLTGTPSGKRITASDCGSVLATTQATAMYSTPTQCAFKPLQSTEIQPICPKAQVLLSENWESGSDGWSFGNEGVTEDWPGFDWKIRSGLPKRKGHAAFAIDPSGGICLESAGNWSGIYWMTSPELTIPAGLPNLTLRFDHYVATEGFDGGNVLISVNGSDPTLIDTYTLNPPNGTLAPGFPYPGAAGGGNTNPKAEQPAWHFADPGETSGSWATTIADLSTLAKAGDKVQLRFEFGIDQCGGIEGWYVDDIAVYSCPVVAIPELKLSGNADPDPDRSMTLTWTRPDGGIGPDELQQSPTGNITTIYDDAESGTDGWKITTSGLGILGWRTSDQKAHGGAMAFVARSLDLPSAGESILEWGTPIPVPAKGDTTLKWYDWYAGESDDAVFVEVHNGKKWIVVHTQSNPLTMPVVEYLTQPFSAHKIDLAKDFAGKTVRLRFRYAPGPDTKPASTALFGWNVDDITLTSSYWVTVLKSSTPTVHLTNLGDGKQFFRIRTSYVTGFGTVVPGPWSEQVSARVKGKLPLVRGSKTTRPQLPATGVGTPQIAFAFLMAAAAVQYLMRRQRA